MRRSRARCGTARRVALRCVRLWTRLYCAPCFGANDARRRTIPCVTGSGVNAALGYLLLLRPGAVRAGIFVWGSKNSGGLGGPGTPPPHHPDKVMDLHYFHKWHRSTPGGPVRTRGTPRLPPPPTPSQDRTTLLTCAWCC